MGLSDVRHQLYIATKTAAETAEDFWKDLHTSLTNLYVYLLWTSTSSTTHRFAPAPAMHRACMTPMLEAKRQGKIRHIGITNHRLPVAREARRIGIV